MAEEFTLSFDDIAYLMTVSYLTGEYVGGRPGKAGDSVKLPHGVAIEILTQAEDNEVCERNATAIFTILRRYCDEQENK